MASSKARPPKALSDDGPVVFPVPSSTPSDQFPPDFKQPSDLVVDPYGNFYCFVCQVSVPRGDANVTQHLTGKKHDNHNKRFTTPQEKNAVRQKTLMEALRQREDQPLRPDPAQSLANQSLPQETAAASAGLNGDTTLNPSSSTPAVPDEDPSSPTSTGMAKRTRRAQLLAEAQRLRSIQIDKDAFLSEIRTAIISNDSDAESISSDDTNAFDLKQRQKPFGPIVYNAPEGPDFFFDSVAEETKPSQASATVREVVIQMEKRQPKSDDRLSARATAEEEGETGEFLALKETGKDQSELREAEEREKARQKARESLIILKDENGEELAPWLLDAEATQRVLCSGDSSVALHYEILEFSRFVSPTKAEADSRTVLVMTVESIVKQLWPDSKVEVFGSYATELFLPASDIDICVTGTPADGADSEFEQLAQAFRSIKGFARSVHFIKATVKLVKIISRKTSMNCDVSIGVPNGPKYVPVIKGYVDSYPALRPLLLVIKCFLQQRNLNEVYSGGLGSYSVLLLVVSHLQMLTFNFSDSKMNLGALLQQFFQLYGRMYNLCLAGMQIKDNGRYFDKFERYHTTPGEVLRFSIEDPNDVTNELARNGFAATRVRKTFANASKTLIKWRRDDSSVPPTPLAAIVQPDELFQLRRTEVIADLEEKGKTPLRDSLPTSNRRSNRTAHFSRGSDSSRTTGANYEDAPQAHRSIPGSKHSLSPERGRGRDPRTSKRLRPSADKSGPGPAHQPLPGGYGPGGSAMATTANIAMHMSGMNPVYPMPGTVPSNTMYGQGMPYASENALGQQYGPVTPGYQYVGQPPMFMGDGMNAGFPPQNFAAVPQQMVPQQMVPRPQAVGLQRMGNMQSQYGRGRNGNGSGGHRGQGQRQRKRGYRPRRGGFRGR